MRRKVFSFLLVILITSSLYSNCIAFEFNLNKVEEEYLLNLSRQTLFWYLKDKSIPNPDRQMISGNLSRNFDCFVTLYKNNKLRGCIGFGRHETLFENVIDRTIMAATRDPRFAPVMYNDLKDIKIEISILSKPIEVFFASPQDLLSKIQQNKDGVLLRTKYGGSVYIPKVWQQIPKKEEFLSRLCGKHGAPFNTWIIDYKNIRVWTFQAVEIQEEVCGRIVVGKKGAVVGSGGAYVLGSVIPPMKKKLRGMNKVIEGEELAPGTIVACDSDIVEY